MEKTPGSSVRPPQARSENSGFSGMTHHKQTSRPPAHTRVLPGSADRWPLVHPPLPDAPRAASVTGQLSGDARLSQHSPSPSSSPNRRRSMVLCGRAELFPRALKHKHREAQRSSCRRQGLWQDVALCAHPSGFLSAPRTSQFISLG